MNLPGQLTSLLVLKAPQRRSTGQRLGNARNALHKRILTQLIKIIEILVTSTQCKEALAQHRQGLVAHLARFASVHHQLGHFGT